MESETSQLCLFVRIDECHLERKDRYCLVIQFGQEDACRTQLLDIPTDQPVFDNNVAIFRLPFDMDRAWNQSIHVGVYVANDDSAGQELSPIELGRLSFPLSDHFTALVSNVTAHRKSQIVPRRRVSNETNSLGSVYFSLWLYICDITVHDEQSSVTTLSVQPWFESSEPQQKETHGEGFDFNENTGSSSQTSSLQLDKKLIKKWIPFANRLFEENGRTLSLMLHRFPIFQCPSTWTSRFWYRSLNFMDTESDDTSATYVVVTLGSASFREEVDDCFRRFRLDLKNGDASTDDENALEVIDTVFSIALHPTERQSWNQTLLLREPLGNSNRRSNLEVSVERLPSQGGSTPRNFAATIALSNLAEKVAYPVQLRWKKEGSLLEESAVVEFTLQVIGSNRERAKESLSMLPRSIHSADSGDSQAHEDVDIVGTLVTPTLMQEIQGNSSWRYISGKTEVASSVSSSKPDASVLATSSPKKGVKKGFSFKNLFGNKAKKAKKYASQSTEREESHEVEGEHQVSLHEASSPLLHVAYASDTPIIIGREEDMFYEDNLSKLRDKGFGYAAIVGSSGPALNPNSSSPSPRSSSSKSPVHTHLDISKWKHFSQLSLSTATHPASTGLNSLCHWRVQRAQHVSASSSLLAGWGLMITVRKRVHHETQDPSLKVAYRPPLNCNSKQRTKRRTGLVNIISTALASDSKARILSKYRKCVPETIPYSIKQSRHLQLTELFAQTQQASLFPQSPSRDLVYDTATLANQSVAEYTPIMRGFLRFSSHGAPAAKVDHIAEMDLNTSDTVVPLRIPLFQLSLEDDTTVLNRNPMMTLTADIGHSKNSSSTASSLWDFAMKDAHADLSKGMEENLKQINTDTADDDESISDESEDGESARRNPFGLAIASTCNVDVPDGREPSLADLRAAIGECGNEIQALRQALRQAKKEKAETQQRLESLEKKNEDEAVEESHRIDAILNDLSSGNSHVSKEYSRESLKKALVRLYERNNAEKKSRKQLQERLLAMEVAEGKGSVTANKDDDSGIDGASSEYNEVTTSVRTGRPRYEVLLCKYRELEEAHTLQNEKLKKFQKHRTQIEQYRSTIKSQEQIIEKMQQWISSKLKSKGQSASTDSNTAEQPGELKRMMDKMQHMLSIKDQRIALLERRLDENAREFSKELTQMKMRLLDAGLNEDFSNWSLPLFHETNQGEASTDVPNESKVTNIKKHYGN
eukprot:gb/GECG01016302.1/.p1 GENE.gb/GECG01016302.1/~~gb/GECG01016302.1/.p1  ORF type:complete len:1214 (+),score=181.92 gb/GECG01016302.1/:1-3642(+)